MSLLPVFVQPPRARHDLPSAPAADRRAPAAARETFAGSLAVALRKPVASLPAVPDAEVGTERGSDVGADVRAEGGAARVTDPMIDAKIILIAPIAVPDMDGLPTVANAPETVDMGGVAVCAPFAPTESWVDGPILLSSMEPARGAPTPMVPVVPQPIDAGDAERCAPDDDATLDDAATQEDDATQEMSGAGAAAAQLIAALPFPPISLPATPVNASNVGEPRGDAEPVAVSFTARSLPAIPSSPETVALVEDHFDAAAATLGAHGIRTDVVATARPELIAPPVAPGRETATPARAVLPGTGAVERDLSRLDPAFRERLERVMERMRTEFGHEVRVVETTRTQARQNALFAQGRTAPGPVVTWTRNSRHLKGLAADLQVDGAWQNPLGYARLADIAKQEGLRTLGARDQGHVELPTDATVSSETLGALLGDLQGEAGDAARKLRAELTQPREAETRANRMAQVSNVAQVARVSTLATVARVAEVARPGAGRESAATNDAVSQMAVTPTIPAAGTTDPAGAMRVVTPIAGVNMADRIAQLMDLQATQASKPLNSVLLRMENAEGADDQIRIDTRGASVDARLGLGNAQQAAALTDRLGELREALERRGLTADSVRVQAASGARNADSVTFSRNTAPVLEMAAMRAMSDSQAQSNLRDQSARDQSARDQQQREAFAREQARHTPRSSSDEPRHRSRREQPEDRR